MPQTLLPPRPSGAMIAVQVVSGIGDYRTGDSIWCERLSPAEFERARNRDVLVPRPAGRFVFGRLVDLDGQRLAILPLVPGARQLVVSETPWIAVAVTLVRPL